MRLINKYLLFLVFCLPQLIQGQRVVTLSVKQPPEFAFSASHQDTTIIKGNSFVLAKDLQVFGGTGDYIFNWSPSTTLSDFAIIRPVAQPADTTDYLLTVADGNGCSFTVNYKVNVVQPDLSIDLKTGWNIISFNVIPWNLNMKMVALSLISDGSMVKVQDETGNSLEDYGFFGGWVNNISDIGISEGYKVKVTRDCQLHVIGLTPVLPFKIPLKSGWNIIGFPHKTEENAQAVVQQLIDRQTLAKVQDELGNALEDYGYFGGWTNNIGNFKPGRGYKIKVISADTLTIFESYPKYAVTNTLEDNSLSEMEVRLYPNPNDGRFRLQLIGPPSEKLDMIILDGLGKTVIHRSLFSFSGKVTHDLEVIVPAGIYSLLIKTREKVVSHQFVVQ